MKSSISFKHALCSAVLIAAGSATLAQTVPADPFARSTRPVAQLSAETREHIAKSMKLAHGVVPDAAISSYYNTVRLANLVVPNLLPPGSDNFTQGKDHPALTPTKVFDQLYFIGDEHVGAYILKTPDGIIQWDAMNNDEEAAKVIEAGYKSLGLDPASIRYLVITHAHGDHYGGVAYFKAKYPKIKVLASAADWDVMDKLREGPRKFGGPPPPRETSVADGETLSLGGTKITFWVTPGHTPGTLSAVIPVTDHGRPHVMGMFGGVGEPLSLKALEAYDASWQRFERLGQLAGVDGILSTHPAYDGALFYITAPAQRKAHSNSWVLGKSKVHAYIGAVHEATTAIRGILAEAPAAR